MKDLIDHKENKSAFKDADSKCVLISEPDWKDSKTMKETCVLIAEHELWKTELTTASPLSHYGIPVLRVITGNRTTDYGPSDTIHGGPGPCVAGDYIEKSLPFHTPEQAKFLELFLSQRGF